jgi:hypothetical protein
MPSNLELTKIFFHDLRTYNSTNFRTLATATLDKEDPVVHKAYSSVVTRYLIFCDKHPEVSQSDKNLLYFKLKIDMIAYYFSQYPDGDLNYLRAFQLELLQYLKDKKQTNSSPIVKNDEPTNSSDTTSEDSNLVTEAS